MQATFEATSADFPNPSTTFDLPPLTTGRYVRVQLEAIDEGIAGAVRAAMLRCS